MLLYPPQRTTYTTIVTDYAIIYSPYNNHKIVAQYSSWYYCIFCSDSIYTCTSCTKSYPTKWYDAHIPTL